MQKWIDSLKNTSALRTAFGTVSLGMFNMAVAQKHLNNAIYPEKNKAVMGFNNNSVIQNGSDSGRFEIDLKNDHPEFIVSEDDARFSTLAQYAKQLGKNVPKNSAMPDIWLEKIPTESRDYIKNINSFELQRVAVISILLNDAIKNGVPLEDGSRSEGYGHYNPVVEKSLHNQDSLRDVIKSYHHTMLHGQDSTSSVLDSLKHSDKINSSQKDMITDILKNSTDTAETERAKRALKAIDTILETDSLLEEKLSPEISEQKNTAHKNWQEATGKLAREIIIQNRAIPYKNIADSLGIPFFSTELEKNFPVCVEYASLGAQLLETAGISDIKLIIGFVSSENTAYAGYHDFILYKSHIIDFTNEPSFTFLKEMRNETEQDFIAGSNAVVMGPNGQLYAYGTGFSGKKSDIALLKLRQHNSNKGIAAFNNIEEIATYQTSLINDVYYSEKAADNKKNPLSARMYDLIFRNNKCSENQR